ncbi:ATP-binding protein [Psychroserpens sp. AS72]|uniref:ATP-binding protein n=1 Tax=Psychroserpens sp. AS72 TaxID=3135775 RepID=UPI003170223E
MQLTKTLEKEILESYNTWLHSYLNGDVKTYDSYFDDCYHFIGSTDNEEFLNRKDTTNFFKETAEQFSGKTDLRNEIKTVELFDKLVFITHAFDAWFLTGNDWTYYGRFRFSSVMQEKENHWKFIYQHFSTTDSKTDDGESIGFDKVNLENQKLREAIKRRTFELEEKNRELEIEGALERIRAQAVAMKQSTDLLEIVVSMRNEFIKLGHEAHYFWHMMWLPNKYEKAMTSGDGTKIGFVMELPRHMHGDIPLLATWEKSKKPTVVYAMDVEAAINYIDKMVHLGNFKNIDPQAPTHDDINHIGGLTFIMARTTHGEIGYSLPGIVKNPPAEDIDILIQFASAFDLAHRRFLDLQKAEKQAREVQIELALEKVRSRTMGMQRSDELRDTALLLFQQVEELGINSFACGFNIWDKDKKFATAWMAGKDRLQPPFRTNSSEDVYLLFREAEKRGDALFVLEQEGKALEDHYKYLVSIPEVKALANDGLSFPTFQIIHCAYFNEGYLMFITHEPVTDAHDIFIRFAKVFEQTYTRFLDLQKAEAQARESEIELALERVRARTMSMQHSDELQEASFLLDQQVRALGIKTWGCAFNIYGENDSNEWFGNEAGVLHTYTVPREGVFKEYYQQGQKGKSLVIKEFSGDACVEHYEYMSSLPVIGDVLKTLKETNNGFPTYQIDHVAFYKYGYLLFITREDVPESHDIFKRFAKVFEQTYTRFLDLQKAEAQARESQIEVAVERIRAQSMAMHHPDDLKNVNSEIYKQLQLLDINGLTGVSIWLVDKNDYVKIWDLSSPGNMGNPNSYSVAYDASKYDILGEPIRILKNLKEDYFELDYPLEKLHKAVKEWFLADKAVGNDIKDAITTGKLSQQWNPFARHNNGLFSIDLLAPPNEDTKKIVTKIASAFNQAYTRFLDLQKAEAQAREAQIEAALEKVRSRTMAMQKGIELQDVVVLLYKELITLGVTNFATCGYVEINEETNRQATWVTSPGGDSLGLFHLPLTGDVHFDARYEAWKKQQTVFHQTVAGKERRTHLEYAITTFNSKEAEEMVLNQFPDPTVFYCFNFSHGYLHLVCGARLSKEEELLLARFTKVFEQTYARFLDLEKAEAQTREAQINLAVERVRAKALAMHKSEEIMEVVAKLKEEVMSLEIPDVIAATIFLKEGEDKVRMWDLSTLEENNNGYEIPFDITFKLKKKDPNLYVKRVWENPEDYFLEVQEAKDFKRIVAWLRENNQNQIANEVEEYTESTKLERLHHAVKKLNNGKLVIDLLNKPSEEMETILTKMGAAFDLAYKRFEDLQKAEAQSRESQIEVALEKVRSRSLAMHKPDELQEVVAVVAEKLQELGVIYDAGGVILCTYFPDNKDVVHWIAVEDFSTSGRYFLPYFDNPIFSEAWESKIRGDEFFFKEFPVEAKNHFFEYAFENSDYKHMPEDYKQYVLKSDQHNLSAAWSKNSAIIIPSLSGAIPSESDAEIMKRFAKVFEQAYIRFMDLQKAEERARETQIDIALERVRSRSMAMHSSEELLDVISVVSEQLQILDFKFAHVSFANNDRSLNYKFWVSAKGQPKPMRFTIPYLDIPMMINVRTAQKKSIPFHTDILTIKEHKQWHQHLLKHGGSKIFTKEENEFTMSRGLSRSIAINPNIMLILANYASIPYSEEENKIIARFGKVFEQSYTRFLDLKKAEGQAREAQIEMALEKVRSRTLAMQKSHELAETSVIVFKQLLELGIAPNRLFIGLVKGKTSKIECWATNEDGSKLANEFMADASKSKTIKRMLEGWKQNNQSLTIDLIGKELKDYFEYLSSEMNIPFIHGLEQKRRVQTVAYFSGGFIGMASPEDQPKETIQLLERFASVFNLTYTRFKDLKVAEAQAFKAKEDLINLQLAKKSAEKSLSDLQQTQKQLIQSEKMASLGELTAGIAHEIQNPLNFVNNFSEVSKELLDEMIEEIENGDIEEAKAIMVDVIQNLEKINHHGKRADGIVKGMLQHSRASGDKKESTDINALVDEYLRLAYHGLRAKDKSFNATLETDYDKNIKTINVISQDIGRVILNLFTNAFYAVDEKKTSLEAEDYKPTVSVITKKLKNKIVISVKDNGNGIPKHVIDKIFQPFFTTKPTGKGTGLGLSMSYDIIKAHGGEFEVETNEGESTTFMIKIPIKNQ